MMRFGDKKPDSADAKSNAKTTKDLVLACFDEITEEHEEQSIVELKIKQRDVNEAAKKRF